jgi:hypothetical protein
MLFDPEGFYLAHEAKLLKFSTNSWIVDRDIKVGSIDIDIDDDVDHISEIEDYYL